VIAYGIDENGKTVEFGRVTLQEGLAMLRARYAHAGTFFESEKDFEPNGVVGFARDGDRHFIEIYVCGPDHLTLRFERHRSGFLGFSERRNELVNLQALEQTENMVTRYFNMDEEAFESFFGTLPERVRQ
jgi:hypothetical protein